MGLRARVEDKVREVYAGYSRTTPCSSELNRLEYFVRLPATWLLQFRPKTPTWKRDKNYPGEGLIPRIRCVFHS